MTTIFQGATSSVAGRGGQPVWAKETNVQYIAACKNPNPDGFGGRGVNAIIFHEVVYSSSGVTASCLTPVGSDEAKQAKVVNLQVGGEELKIRLVK